MWSIRNGLLEPLIDSALAEPYNLPRQALPETFWQNGYLDAIRAKTIRSGRSMTGGKIAPLIMDPESVIDIDDPHTLALTALVMDGSPP